MSKLELKHLAIAMANNQQVFYFDDERESYKIYDIIELREEELTISDGEYEHYVSFDDVKLILRPLSDVSKEIQHNGEKFFPLYMFNKHTDGKICFESLNSIMLSVGFRDEDVLGAPLAIIEDLLKWNFDIYELIPKGLAVDINKLNKVL